MVQLFRARASALRSCAEAGSASVWLTVVGDVGGIVVSSAEQAEERRIDWGDGEFKPFFDGDRVGLLFAPEVVDFLATIGASIETHIDFELIDDRPNGGRNPDRRVRTAVRRLARGEMVTVNDAQPQSWSWTVVERIETEGRGIVVLGEHVGSSPVVGEPCVIRDDRSTVRAVVNALVSFHHRDEAGDFTGHSEGLALRDVGLDDVRVGAVITPDTKD